MVDKKLLKLFSKEDSLGIKELIKCLKILDNCTSDLLGTGPLAKCGTKENKIEIKEKPGNIEDIFRNVSYYFRNCINWKSTKTHLNITPPVPIPTIAVSAVSNILNQTLVTDTASGNMAQLELDMVKYISDLVGWNYKKSSGVFTFGGTATNFYGIKIGINKCDSDAFKKGVRNTIIIDSDQAHSAHKVASDWLGLGMDNYKSIKTEEGKIDITTFKNRIEKYVKEKKKIGCVVLSGGTTYDWEIDDIKEVNKFLVELSHKCKLDYKPHLHVDSVIGWVFLLFKDYDFLRNPLKFSMEALLKIKNSAEKISKLKFADSFGMDFHKTGFCPYPSSLFMIKNRDDWNVLTRGAQNSHHQDFKIGSYAPGRYTLETSRSTMGAVSSYVTLSLLGKKGFQEIIGNLINLSIDIKEKLRESKCFDVCNMNACGCATMFLLLKDNEKLKYGALMNENNNDKVKENNNLQEEFQLYIKKSASRDEGWLLSFSNEYQKNKYGYKIATLKLYPMSPFLTLKDNKELIKWLIDKRRTFLRLKYENNRG